MKILVLIVIICLLGSTPIRLWIGKFFHHVSLREHSSDSTGTANTFRILGSKAGMMTLIIDMLKGVAATLLPRILGVMVVSPILVGLFATIGHTFPIFAKFKSGRAVVTSTGVFLGSTPVFLLYLLIILVGVLYLFSMISLSSVVATAVIVVSVLIFPAFGFLLLHCNLFFTLIIALIASITTIRYKDSIIRIRRHEESLAP